jgi:uncharacterized protein YabE (DUF348 family)
MKYVNGGFANSVDVQPGTNEDTGKVNVSINIFGGGEKKKITLPTPPKIQQLLKAYEVALKKQDPTSDDIKMQLEKYYADLKISIAEKFIGVMKEMDLKAKQTLIQSIKEINGKYQ